MLSKILGSPFRIGHPRRFISPSMVVAIDTLLAESKPTQEVQAKVSEAALVIAPYVAALHFDINCDDYLHGKPKDNRQVFSPEFLSNLKILLAEMAGANPAFDLHFLGCDLAGLVRQYKEIVDHISFELGVVRAFDQDSFANIVKLLKFRNVSVGLIGLLDNNVEQDYLPYLGRVDVFGVTAAWEAALRTTEQRQREQELPLALAKVRQLRAAPFSGRIILQNHVTEATIPLIAAAGADVLVCGSAIFNGGTSESAGKLQWLNFLLRDE